MLITLKSTGGIVIVLQEEIVTLLVDQMECTREQVFDFNWLDIEPLYEAEGWTVRYVKPAYFENFKSYFEFIPSRPPKHPK